MVHLALNHGAQGIIYFSYKSGDRPITEHEQLFGAIRQVNREIRLLKGPLLKRPEQGAVAVELAKDERGGIVIGAPRLAPADCALRRFGGRRFLSVVNPDPWRKEVVLGFPDSPRIAAELFVEEPAGMARVAERAMRLALRPFQVRLFILE